MKTPDAVTGRQLAAVAFVGVLSPLIRRFPRVLAERAGRAAWLSVPMAALPAGLMLLLARLLYRGRPAGTGFGAVLEDTLGRRVGKLLTGLCGLWLLFYAGFLLRSGAARFLSTVYQNAGPGVFIVSMAVACAAAAMGSFKTLARAAMLLRPLLAALLAAVVLLVLRDVDLGLLLPVTVGDLLPDARGALLLANLLAVTGFLGFAGGLTTDGVPFRLRDWAGWAGVLLALVALMTAGCLGMFGPALTARMAYPFFMLARDASALGSLERFEPVVVAVWVFADFIFLSALLWIAARNLSACLPRKKPAEPVLAAFCGVLAGTAAFLIPSELSAFAFFSETLVPVGSAVFSLGVPLLALIIGAARKKLYPGRHL